MSEQLILSSRIYTERGCMDGALHIKDHAIVELIPKERLPHYQHIPSVDYQNARIIPGIIEMHVHGYKGWYAMSPKKEDLIALSLAMATSGVTAFTPTNHLRTDILNNHQAVAQAMKEEPRGARILGIHMEGPFISLERLGSVLPEEVTAPNLDLMKTYYETAEGHITTVTLAPEVEGNDEIIRYCVAHGINVCMGHTNATYQQAKRTIDMGAIITQKTGNCMRPMHQRELGVVGAALLDQRIYNELNSDLRHVSKEFLDLFYHMKGVNKICLVADGGVMSGMPTGSYQLPERGRYTVGEDFLLRDYRGVFDGSTKHILFGIQNWVETLHIPLEEAIIMACYNPARVLKIDQKKGSIKEQKDADFAVITDAYEVIATYVEGKLVYDQQDGIQYENAEYLAYKIA